ncbi:MAG: haloacid dehalogenase type II [Anaerolineae bacterium]
MLNFDDFAVLTFDCYGTLIDWESGIWEALEPVLTTHAVALPPAQALELYGTLEADIESGSYRAYKAVLRGVLEGIGARLRFTPTEAELDRFSHSVENWRPFPDSPRALKALKQKYKLAIVSNVDDDLFAHSARRLEVPFDYVITAQQVQSYKPATAHFHEAFRRIGVPRRQILHVAQSLYHDIGVAKSLGLSTVWVNRRHGQGGSGATPPADAAPDVEVPDLASRRSRTAAGGE